MSMVLMMMGSEIMINDDANENGDGALEDYDDIE